MNFSNIDFDSLLTNGLKFSLGLVKKNVTKAVSDNAFKVIKNVVFRKNSKQNIKNNNIQLKAGDSVTFVVTKKGLVLVDDQNILNDDQNALNEDQNLLINAKDLHDPHHFPTCSHPKTKENVCLLCFRNEFKSKL